MLTVSSSEALSPQLLVTWMFTFCRVTESLTTSLLPVVIFTCRVMSPSRQSWAVMFSK